MPNKPDPSNVNTCVRLSRELYKKARKRAQELNIDYSTLVRVALSEFTKNVSLTAEEARQVAEEIARAERGN